MTFGDYMDFLDKSLTRSDTITLHLDKSGGLFAGIDGVRIAVKDREALDRIVNEIVSRVSQLDRTFEPQHYEASSAPPSRLMS